MLCKPVLKSRSEGKKWCLGSWDVVLRGFFWLALPSADWLLTDTLLQHINIVSGTSTSTWYFWDICCFKNCWDYNQMCNKSTKSARKWVAGYHNSLLYFPRVPLKMCLLSNMWRDALLTSASQKIYIIDLGFCWINTVCLCCVPQAILCQAMFFELLKLAGNIPWEKERKGQMVKINTHVYIYTHRSDSHCLHLSRSNTFLKTCLIENRALIHIFKLHSVLQWSWFQFTTQG